MLWTILIPIILIVYLLTTLIWMQHTFKFSYTVNHYAFRRELESGKRKSLIHYIEVIATILLIIGFITTIISQLQIIFKNRRRK